jgi:hypothetical protein
VGGRGLLVVKEVIILILEEAEQEHGGGGGERRCDDRETISLRGPGERARVGRMDRGWHGKRGSGGGAV